MIENPYTQPHYLTGYWPIRPALIDNNRRERGDYMRKPTQYFFINMQPQNNFIFEPMTIQEYRRHDYMTAKDGQTRAERRSEMSPDYANRFIREFLIKEDAQKIESQNASPR